MPIKEYKPRIPYPERLIENKIEEERGKILEPYRHLKINSHFVKSLLQDPPGLRPLLEHNAGKGRLDGLTSLSINEE
ncbi:hypothetical protein J0J24_24640, partial [Vibrio vulnificus]|uniref:hypothetical protein n=1 Tax=Vibrio vulnificus TaxID=672 RepID=UPI0019D415FE